MKSVIGFKSTSCDRTGHSEMGCKAKYRIVYLVGQLGLGGLERQLFYVLRTMDRPRYKPVVVVWDHSDKDPYIHEIESLGVPVRAVGNDLSRTGKILAFRRMVSQYKPEVVHSYSFYTNLAAWWASLGSTTLAIGSIRNNFIFDRLSTGMILGRACARWPHVHICNSGAAKETADLCTSLFKPRHTHVVRNALDLTYFNVRPLPHSVTLLAVGNLYPRKRWDRLIKIISDLSMRGIKVQVRHVGDGPLRRELEELASRIGVANLVQFLGVRDDIPKLLADCSFLVHTAEEEGCPNVIMEAMACGRAVVAMDAGDIPYLVEDRKTGFVVRRGDTATFAECVSQLISDHQLCLRMGAAARAKAEQEFRLERLVSETLSVYKAAGWRDA
jgi:glycosyltransferase involved in cell wall biosynthesis